MYNGCFELLVLPPKFVSGLDSFVTFTAVTFISLSDLVEIVCEPRNCMMGGHFWGDWTRLVVVGSKVETS